LIISLAAGAVIGYLYEEMILHKHPPQHQHQHQRQDARLAQYPDSDPTNLPKMV